MASELSSYIDNELKKMEEQPENQRLLSALRVKARTCDQSLMPDCLCAWLLQMAQATLLEVWVALWSFFCCFKRGC